MIHNSDSCPSCGEVSSWRRRDGWTLASGEVVGNIQPGATFERKEPSRKADPRADVLTPFLQSLVTALVGGIAGGMILSNPIKGMASAGIVFSVTWLILLVDHRRALWLVERITGADIDKDGAVGEPPPRKVQVEVSETSNNGRRIRYLDLPVNEEGLTGVAHAVLVKRANFSRRGLSDVLSQKEYERLSNAMLGVGLLADLPGNKRELTAVGRSMLQQLLD